MSKNIKSKAIVAALPLYDIGLFAAFLGPRRFGGSDQWRQGCWEWGLKATEESEEK
jgi:hypothetical protein